MIKEEAEGEEEVVERNIPIKQQATSAFRNDGQELFEIKFLGVKRCKWNQEIFRRFHAV